MATGCQADPAAPSNAEIALPDLGFMGTIPLYWGEAGGFHQLLAGEGATHWARGELEADYRLLPLDTLEDGSLAGVDYLLLAQPRPLSPSENVALDAWVRQGGKLLLFVDPLLAGESRFALGDRRRPQGAALLSPILGHWGLELQFDDTQDAGFTLASAGSAEIPVNLSGSLALIGDEPLCALSDNAIVADCTIGAGRAVIVADADLLDLHEPHPAAATALHRLVEHAFGGTGDRAGNR